MGLIGLGKMGGNMVKRLVGRDHRVVVWDMSEEAVEKARHDGAEAADGLGDLVSALEVPRVVWLMLPHGEATSSTVDELLGLLATDDILVDGGNSRWLDSMEHAGRCAEQGVCFLDIGMSGGIWGLEEGYCMMAGGPENAYEQLVPLLEALAPEGGCALVGPSGAGHFVKMIHNAIEYAMLQAIGEGFEALQSSDFQLDLERIASLWTHGAVIRSWLLELAARAFDQEGPGLEAIAPVVSESGTGRWTVEYALDRKLPLPTITQALFERFASQAEERFSNRLIAALRNQFGGHPVMTGNDTQR
jgi:6-phosphogluconate dehydrogenase